MIFVLKQESEPFPPFLGLFKWHGSNFALGA